MQSETSRGTAYGVAAFFLWGAFPLYFRALDRSGAVEIVLHRVVWSLLVCLALLAATHAFREFRTVLRDRRQVGVLGVAAVLIALNWGIYVYAVNSDQVVEASLGYFINPLVMVALGVVVLGEQLRRLQWVAVGVGALAVAVLTIAYGHPPTIALSLAASFGLYGLIKRRAGVQVGAAAGLATETLVLAPFALIALLVIGASGDSTFTADAPWQALLLMSAGVVTAAPLLLFASAARRLPLATIGLIQYLTPVLQLLCGVLLLDEHMPLERWIGFGMVWVALVIFTFDSIASARRNHASHHADAVDGATTAGVDPVSATPIGSQR
ncbi:MAG: EamA family transporter RarD [Solirubrobacteraceae bacterium]|nr:EamA family transporter RarD [Solirubrobacteraceae bacterium]